MIDFETAIELGEEVLSALEKLSQIIHGQKTSNAISAGSVALPNLLLAFRRKLLASHAKRHLVSELTATGKLSESEAQTMVSAAGVASAEANPGAMASSWGSNILAWLAANGPTISEDIAAAIPIVVSLIALFGG